MDKLNRLIADAQALEVKAEQDRTAVFAAQCEAARAAVAAAFDGLREEIGPYADGGNAWTDNGKITTWWTVIAAPGLAPFCAGVQFTNFGGECKPFLQATAKPEAGWHRYAFGDLPEFLLERKRDGDKAAAKARSERLDDLRRKLDGYDSQRAQALSDADDVLAELLALDPAGAEAWNKLHMTWQVWRNQKDAERAEEEALKARRAALATEYETAYATYYTDLQRALDANGARLDEFQKELDNPFQAWELYYAVVGTDEDGNRIADTRSVNALSGEPDAEGYWVTAGKNWVERTKFLSLFSLSGPVERRPTDEDLCGAIVIGAPHDHYWRRIYCHPLADREQVRTRALMTLEPWPAVPEVPEDLDPNMARDIRRKVVSGATGDYDIDVPF